MALILDGKVLSAAIRQQLKATLAQSVSRGGVQPAMTAVQVGDDLPSTVYIRAKQRACEDIGIAFTHLKLPENTSMEELRARVNKINNDPAIHGLIVQSPLPRHLNEIEVQRMVAPEKDVDCFHPENVGLLYIGKPRFQPGTAAAVIELMNHNGIETAGRRAVIIGRSTIVGRPLALMMMLKGRGGDATVTVCHSRTRDIPNITRECDIVIAAVGSAEMVRGDWVRDGAVVIDVGINRLPDPSKKAGYRLVGDVAFDEIEPKAAAITPVPGGVGPMTVAILVSNVMRAAGYKL